MTGKLQDDNKQSINDFQSLLRAHQDRKFFSHWKILTLVLALLFIGLFIFTSNGSSKGIQYHTQKIQKGELVVKVTATGNLEPTNQVNVGSELSGTIAAVYVDDDDHVKKGQILAELDLSSFQDAVAKSQAAVAVAKANLKLSEATVNEAQAKLSRYLEVARLSNNKVPSKTEMETAEAELARAKADTASANASILQAIATLHNDETNLEKAKIKSPINGVVLERDVDPGQAVAASLQAVTLFTIAEDLSKMELKVDVDEADVGQVKKGLKASFTVDAWPERRFEATITRVGFNAADDDGVISYPAILQVSNNDLSLRPGMTATAEITTITRDKALLIPNAALRFTPQNSVNESKSSKSLVSSLMPRPPRDNQKTKAISNTHDTFKVIWILQDNQPTPVQIKTGATNGKFTEIVSGEITEGEEVITEAISQ